jgi:hypothetical protein
MNEKKILNDVKCNKNIIKINGPGRTMSPTEVTGRMDLLPTTMDEGIVGLGGRKREMLSRSGAMWFNALESMTHSISEGSS